MSKRQNGGSRCGTDVVQVSTVSFQSGMAVTVAAGADAIGEHTFSSIRTNVTVVDRGLLTYAAGTSSAIAAALSASGSAFATSYTQLDVSGADFTAIDTRHSEGGNAEGTSAVSAVDLDFFALDLKWLDFSREAGRETSSGAAEPNLSGNLADFSASIEAYGDNGYVDLQVDALALEDQLSSTTLLGTAAIDGDASYERYAGTSKDNVITAGDANALVQAGRGDDRVTGGSGDDWIFGGEGRDQIKSGAGNDTVFGEDADDRIQSGDGDDWLFGGKGDDTLEAGDGNDLVMGGAGRDAVDGGAGDDLIDAGSGKDTVRGGSGNDIFRLGAERGDDDDRYWGGAGADLYLITDDFDSDLIMDFSLAGGDRLVMPSGDWDSEAALRQLNGTAVTLQRASGDADDLVLTFELGRSRAELTLDEFFAFNPGYAALPRRGTFSDAAALPLLQDLFGDDAGLLTADHELLFQVGQYLGELG